MTKILNELDHYLKWSKLYRKFRGGTWHQHQFNSDAQEICISFIGTFWARYGKINRYSDVITSEQW